jgi:hypothetical protein
MRLTCPRCGKAGLVRAERVIRGSTASTEFFCGSCLHQWSQPDAPQSGSGAPSTPPNLKLHS